jgi:hypothetical protein
MGSSDDKVVIKCVNQIGYFWNRARGHLLDDGNAIFLVTRVNAFRAIAKVEALIVIEAGVFSRTGTQSSSVQPG